ncbi:hypothetical protein KJ763_01600 [Patescibacteria group bacterium]|nr:hypothetical protein [Patescibacteria group bacterium]
MPDIIINKKAETEIAQPQSQSQSQEIVWQAPEYEFRKKTSDWFWTMGIIGVAFIFVAIIFKNLLLAILILIGGFSLILYSARKPKIISFSIGPGGVKISERIYYYEDLKSFWVNYSPPQRKELIIESKKTVMPHITIMLGDTDPTAIRNLLLKFLPEQKIEESLITTITKLLGF